MSDAIIDLDQLIKDGKALPDIQAIRGERWFALDTSIEEDMVPYWGGDFGCSSEYNRLRAVLLHRPGNELNSFDFDKVRFREPVDPKKFQEQHDLLAEYYRAQGVAVHYTEKVREDRPNAVFCRDKLFMTPEGAVVCRLAMAERRGEERYISEALGRIGVPIVKTISGRGIFEGANAMWVDRETCILSLSVRANREGYDQMEHELRRQGVKEIIPMQIPYGHAHIDGLLNLASPEVAVLHASQVPYVVVDALKKKGYKIIETPSQTEAKYGYSVNFVAIEPGHVVTSVGSPRTVELMEKAGVKVDVLDLSELNKGKGSCHCMTAFLKRDAQ
ncbi:dimethylarginine dimethylaminohydrolase family protein [Acidaminobacter hydrogenoformans]|uniref:N-Dimethylarginine dimethylaminohydrolase n=1 Tax=Acidaminobacter hydrogenoformans DSM 2784 TaxID=1120920 RepID=A0A1G5RPZ9_9FIRM|nr:arginine deiminase family protein [Acidaminobacter hydrogenoformans]SCZ76036.1 N-Dimethylarginine dimethylaminohydrolase [Acidaminobacter hydrogenoformans DSM 2784]